MNCRFFQICPLANPSHNKREGLGSNNVTLGEEFVGSLGGAKRGVGTVSTDEVRSAGPRLPYADLRRFHETNIPIAVMIAANCNASSTLNSTLRPNVSD